MRNIKMLMLVCVASLALCGSAVAETPATSNVSMHYTFYNGQLDTGTTVFTGQQWVLCAGCGRITTSRDKNGRYHTLHLLKRQTLINAAFGYVGPNHEFYGKSKWDGKGHVAQTIEVNVDGVPVKMKLDYIFASVSDPNYPTLPPVKGGCDQVSCGK